MIRARRFNYARKVPAIDGEKARRAAQKLLREARTLDNLTAESLANSWGLKPATAAEMLAREQQRRRANGN